MSENMEIVTFKKTTIFDRKVRKPGDTVTVSEGEAENLRRIGVIDEKDTDTGSEPEIGNDNGENNNTSNVAPVVPENPVPMPPQSNNETSSTMPPALNTMSYSDMSRKELMAELKKNNITIKGNPSKSVMITKLTEHKSGE